MPNTLQLNWTDATWTMIQNAIHDEAMRARVARKFLPLQTPADATTISSDTIRAGRDGRRTFTETVYPRVAEAAAYLQGRHAGRLALVLPTQVYPDTFAAIPGSPTTPKDQITAFVEDRFYSSSALPPDRGLVL